MNKNLLIFTIVFFFLIVNLANAYRLYQITNISQLHYIGANRSGRKNNN